MAEGDRGAAGLERRTPRAALPLHVARGFLIGTAELVPGVSGGTVALVTGVYERLIGSAAHVVSAVRRLVAGPHRVDGTRTELRRTDWWLVLPVLVGMAAAVVSVAGVMSAFVTDHPELARGLFLGLVAVSVAVPVRMLPSAHRPAGVDAGIVAVAAVVAAGLVTLAAGSGSMDDPPPFVVVGTAAIAVCALVVPGVSGSFFLLAVGIYTATLDAVHSRDLGYLALFAGGAVLGLASFVQLLRWLLEEHRRTTLLAMTGLMVGSLRALWPWQGGDSGGGETDGPGSLMAPYDPVAGPVLLALLGGAVVLVLIVVEERSVRRAAAG